MCYWSFDLFKSAVRLNQYHFSKSFQFFLTIKMCFYFPFWMLLAASLMTITGFKHVLCVMMPWICPRRRVCIVGAVYNHCWKRKHWHILQKKRQQENTIRIEKSLLGSSRFTLNLSEQNTNLHKQWLCQFETSGNYNYRCGVCAQCNNTTRVHTWEECDAKDGIYLFNKSVWKKKQNKTPREPEVEEIFRSCKK